MKNYYSKYFLSSISSITEEIDYKKIEKLTFEILKIKKKMEEYFFLELVGVLLIVRTLSMILEKFVILKLIPHQIMLQN